MCMQKQFFDYFRFTKFAFSGTWKFSGKNFRWKKNCSDLDKHFFGYVLEDFKNFFPFMFLKKNVGHQKILRIWCNVFCLSFIKIGPTPQYKNWIFLDENIFSNKNDIIKIICNMRIVKLKEIQSLVIKVMMQKYNEKHVLLINSFKHLYITIPLTIKLNNKWWK